MIRSARASLLTRLRQPHPNLGGAPIFSCQPGMDHTILHHDGRGHAATPAIMTSTEPLPLATYAQALAHLLRRRGVPKEKLLEALGITAETFQKADAFWMEQLVQSYAQRKGIVAMKFAE